MPLNATLVCRGLPAALRWEYIRPAPSGGYSSIEIEHGVVGTPFDVHIGPQSGFHTTRTGEVAGLPAIFREDKSGSGGSIYVLDGAEISFVRGAGVSFEQLKEIAAYLAR